MEMIVIKDMPMVRGAEEYLVETIALNVVDMETIAKEETLWRQSL